MGLYLAEWLGVMREGASQIQLLPCGLVPSCTVTHTARLVAGGKGECSSPRPHGAYLFGEDFLAIWDSAR